jgi:hypothetical protein
MTYKTDILCQWKDCSAVAAKHLCFGVGTDEHDPYVATHGDYCLSHLILIEQKFSDCDEFTIGNCPDCGGAKKLPSFKRLLNIVVRPN